MECLFLEENKLKKGSIMTHVISCAIIQWGNTSGRQCTSRYCFGEKKAERYKKKHNLTAGVSNHNTNSKEPIFDIYINKHDENGRICEREHFGTYTLYYLWTISKELEFLHRSPMYRMIWSIKYFLSNLFNK